MHTLNDPRPSDFQILIYLHTRSPDQLYYRTLDSCCMSEYIDSIRPHFPLSIYNIMQPPTEPLYLPRSPSKPSAPPFRTSSSFRRQHLCTSKPTFFEAGFAVSQPRAPLSQHRPYRRAGIMTSFSQCESIRQTCVLRSHTL